jgi:O-antigen ligase
MSAKKKQSAAKKGTGSKQGMNANPVIVKEEKNRLFLPVVLIMAVIPLIVHLTIVHLDLNEAYLFGQTVSTDLFSQAKAFWLLISSVILIILFVVNYKKIVHKHSRLITTYVIAGGTFALFTFLSALFSEYSTIAFWGVHDRAEGAFILCCYIFLLLYSMYAYRTQRDYRNIMIALGIVVVVSAVLGTFQYFGHDLITTDFGRFFTVSPWDRDKIDSFSLASKSGRMYGTFYHWDYAGSFAAIAVPVFTVLALAAKSLRARVSLWCMMLLSFWILLGSTSRAGIVGVVAAMIFGIILFGKLLVQHWKISVSGFAIFVITLIGMNVVSNGKLFYRIPSLVSDIASIFQTSETEDYLSKLPVKDVAVEDNTIVLVTQQNDTLKATLQNNRLKLVDGNGQTVAIKNKNGSSVISDERFSQFSFGLVPMGLNKESQGMVVRINGVPQFYFRIGDDNKLYLTNSTGTVDFGSAETPPHFGFSGKERLGSSRGYIWSRTLPMVAGHLLLGAGPDTFVLYFPQNDLFGKYWAYGTTNMLVDKPHNLYLQILFGEGGIALLAFLTIVILYLVDSFRLYAFKKQYRKNQIFGIALCLGVVGYLCAGMFNDSVVSVAPVFWIILGVGIAVNYENRRELISEKAE